MKPSRMSRLRLLSLIFSFYLVISLSNIEPVSEKSSHVKYVHFRIKNEAPMGAADFLGR